MATYKVIQDIEAEDKLLGPLTLKQFIYAIIVVVCGFIAFKLAATAWYLALPFLPPMLVFGVLAAPLGRDQPTEIWLLAKIRFFLKPRRRIWDQSGQLDYVTITVPKIVDPASYTNNLSQTEVKSRLKALSDTIDSRGWAVKNVNTNLYAQPNLYQQIEPTTDRLVQITKTPDPVPGVDIKADEDILDEENNPVAQQLDQMISASTQDHRQKTLKKMQQIRQEQAEIKQVRSDSGDSNQGWFMNTARQKLGQAPDHSSFTSQNFSAATPGSSQLLISQQPSADDQQILAQGKTRQIQQSKVYANMHNLRPNQTKNGAVQVTSAPDPAIIGLANNDDFNVATIARQAKQKDLPESEITVSLR